MFQIILSIPVIFPSLVFSSNMISTCSQQEETVWNYQEVGAHLRSWLKSVTNIRQVFLIGRVEAPVTTSYVLKGLNRHCRIQFLLASVVVILRQSPMQITSFS